MNVYRTLLESSKGDLVLIPPSERFIQEEKSGTIFQGRNDKRNNTFENQSAGLKTGVLTQCLAPETPPVSGATHA